MSESGFERWLRVLQGDIAAYRAGDRERAVAASLGSTRELRKRYERSLARAYVLGVASIELATSSVSDSASRAVTNLLVYLGFAFAIGLVIGL